jgi:hypothetical protein
MCEENMVLGSYVDQDAGEKFVDEEPAVLKICFFSDSKEK